MLSHWKALLVSLVLLSGLCLPCAAVEVLVDGAALEGDLSARVVDGSTYVSLRALTQRLRPGAQISWDGAALVRDSDLTLSAAPGACYIEANGRSLYVPSGVLAEAGRVLVPVRTLAQALGAQVRWDGETGTVHVSSGAAAIVPAAS